MFSAVRSAGTAADRPWQTKDSTGTGESVRQEEEMEEFSIKVFEIIRMIPRGMVCSYGRIAGMAGSPRGARQVARLLHSSSRKQNLPWHRVVNASGEISLPGEGGVVQRKLLESEGVSFSRSGRINLRTCLWSGESHPDLPPKGGINR